MAFFINNRFTRWPTVFSDLPNLEQIDLSFNNLTEIPAEIAMYPALKELSVSFNYLSVLPEHYATMEPTYISVSGNTLCSLSTTMMEWLDTYEFNGSNREWLQDQWCDAHATDSALVRKFLDFNGWNDLPVAAVIRSSAHGVERIDVSFETRRTWQRSATGRAQLVFSGSLRMAASLRSLDLSGNHITILPDSLDQICHITELDLSDNDCVTLPEFMATFNNLTSLDLSGNLLENLPPAVAEWADRYNPGWRERQRTTRAPSNINTSPARHPLRITVRHNGQSAVIEAHIAQAFTAEIAVYSVTGRKVATLAKGNLAAGVCTFNLGDIRLGAGMYLVTVASADDKCARVRFVNH